MKLSREVAVVGAGMTRFHHRIHADKSSRELFAEAALEAAASVDKGFELRDAEALFVGNFSSDLFETQTHTGAIMADWLALNPRPATRLEDACASSGVAMNVGVMAIASGMYDVVLVGGVEKMCNLPTDRVTDTLAMAADAIYEVAPGFTFPGLYASLATAHFSKWGSTWEQLQAVSIKNHHNGALNPKAQFQAEVFDTGRNLGERRGMVFKDVMEFLRSPLNAVVAHPLRLYDCCPVSDGAAVVVLAAKEVAGKFTDTPARIAGIGQASDVMSLHDRADLTTLLATRHAAKQAYGMAGIEAKDVDVADVHDCFTIAEVLASEDLGFFPKGQGGKAAEEGRTALTGDHPINPGGGLKAKGHPVGATGAAMAYEMFKQVRGQADRNQVKGAEIGLSHNVGASGATVAVQVYRR